MAKERFKLDLFEIVPMIQEDIVGTFVNIDKEFLHLKEWYYSDAISSQNEKKSRTYVAKYEGKVVGYISLSLSLLKAIPKKDNTTKYNFQVLLVGKLLVDPLFRGRGIGDKMVKFALDMAEVLDNMVGCAGVLVHSNKNVRTVNFYSEFGFVRLLDKDSESCVPMFFSLLEKPVLK